MLRKPRRHARRPLRALLGKAVQAASHVAAATTHDCRLARASGIGISNAPVDEVSPQKVAAQTARDSADNEALGMRQPPSSEPHAQLRRRAAAGALTSPALIAILRAQLSLPHDAAYPLTALCHARAEVPAVASVCRVDDAPNHGGARRRALWERSRGAGSCRYSGHGRASRRRL